MNNTIVVPKRYLIYKILIINKLWYFPVAKGSVENWGNCGMECGKIPH